MKSPQTKGAAGDLRPVLVRGRTISVYLPISATAVWHCTSLTKSLMG